MTHWQVFQFVCECLRSAISRDRPAIPKGAVPWPEVLEAASYHLVTPAAAWCLRDSTGVPRDVADYFDAALFLNRERNKNISNALTLALQSLNAVKISPVLLKGAAALAEDLYPDFGMRVLGDIDLLVPETRILDASRVLTEAGFEPTREQKRWFSVVHHHLPIQIHPEFCAGIEVHKRVMINTLGTLVNTRSCLEHAKSVQFRGMTALLPSATDRVAHNIAHAQVEDGDHQRGVPQLRQLLDLVMIRERYEVEINWAEIVQRFDQRGLLPAVTDTLDLTEALFGQSMPEVLLPLHHNVALDRLKAALDNPRVHRRGALTHMVRSYARRVQKDPLCVFNVLDPKSWPSRLSSIAHQLRPGKW